MARFSFAGGTNIVLEFGEAASQSFKAGQPVYLVSGLVTACASNGQAIMGIALANASTTTHTKIPVQIATPNTYFKGTITNSGATATATADDVGHLFALYVSTNDCYVDIEDKSNDALKVVNIVEPTTSSAGNADGDVLFKFLDAASQWEDVEV